MLRVRAERADITTWKGDAIVVNLFEGVARPAGGTGAVDHALGGAISDVINSGDLKGKTGETALLYTRALGAPRVLVVGLGKAKGFALDDVRKAAGATVRAFKGTKVHTAATLVHGAGVGGIAPDVAARALTEAAISASYTFERKGQGKDKGAGEGKGKGEGRGDDEKDIELTNLVLVENDAAKARAVRAGVAAGSIVGECQTLARNVASVSGREATPATIASFVFEEAAALRLTCTVLGPDEIREEKMGGLLAVAQGSHEEPRFVVIEHAPKRAKLTVCIVGKGVTFDTGGISIKSGDRMDEMRFDKSGAAATYGAIFAAARLKLPVRVIALTPLAENMPSGTAVKPGDVITMRSGTTVDVLNTDAEGRLVLADALDYAKKFEPDFTVDLATLTGACSVALGTQCAALVGNDARLVKALKRAGEESHERVWELPFFPEYEKQIKGVVGDIKNIGGRNAGTITGGKFLEKFAPEHWAHLDIASTAWNTDKPAFNEAYYPKEGATGVGVRLLVTWLESL